MQAFDLVRPRGEAAAFGAAAEKPSSYIGGGTDLMRLLKDHDQSPQRLVDLDFVLSDVVDVQSGSLRIGALSRMSDTAAHPLVLRDFPVVSQALLASASPQVRNMAKIGGNLLQRTRCGYFRDTAFLATGASPAPDVRRSRARTGCTRSSVAAIIASRRTPPISRWRSRPWMLWWSCAGPDGAREVALTDFHSARVAWARLPMVGVAAAVANAVYHATGRRVRRVPIRIEDVLLV